MEDPSAVPSLPGCLLPPFPPPLEAPVALDGVDVSLATEVLPPPPPLLALNSKKPAEHWRKRVLPSYLPSTDPGSTYTTGTGVKVAEYVTTDEDVSERVTKRKRQRLDKNEPSQNSIADYPIPADSGPAEHQLPIDAARASSSEAPPLASQRIAEIQETPSEPSTSLQAEANTEIPISSVPPHVNGKRSRRSSGLLAASRLSQLDWSVSGQGVLRRKGTEERSNPDASMNDGSPEGTDDGRLTNMKGKGKERASPTEDKSNATDCAVCKMSLAYTTSGAVMCDGCPRSFHLCCLNPPLDESEIQKGEWFCVKCEASRQDKLRPHASHPQTGRFWPLLRALENELPSIFLLPEDIRSYFRDVGTTMEGAYIDTAELRTLKSSRPGIIEERDPYRLKDRQGLPVLCYHCSTSAAPLTYSADQGLPPEIAPGLSKYPPTFTASIVINQRTPTRRQSLPINVNSGRGGSATISELSPDQSLLPNFLSPNEPFVDPLTYGMDSSSDIEPKVEEETYFEEDVAPEMQPASAQRRSFRRGAPLTKDRTSRAVGPRHRSVDDRIPPAATETHPTEVPGLRFDAGNSTSGWRAMISCDYCLLSWHWDCLSPPMVCGPPTHKKWMCPNHMEHVLPKRRVPRVVKPSNVIVIGTSGRHRRIGPNVEIIPMDDIRHQNANAVLQPLLRVDEGARDRRRPPEGYATGPTSEAKHRKAELGVRVDFWNFANRWKKETASAPSSGPHTDKAALQRERARRTLSSSSSLSSLSSPSNSETESEPKRRLSESYVSREQAALTLLSLNETRSRGSSALDLQELYRSAAATNGILYNESREQLQALVRTALKGNVSAKESEAKPLSSSFKIRIPALAARHASATKASASPRRSTRQRDGAASGSETPPPFAGRTSDSKDPLRKRSTTASALPVTDSGLSAEEVASLRAVRDLLARKGERAVLQWLQS